MEDGQHTGLRSAYALRTPEEAERFYRDWAAEYDTEFAGTTRYRLPEAVAQAYDEASGAGPVLDVGAGTGLVAAALEARGIGPVDALDISADMLAQAARKRVCRTTVRADLTRPLPLGDASYAGVVSAGTFTHGHVGPDALEELLRIARPRALFALSINAGVWRERGFAARMEALAPRIEALRLAEVPIYGDPDRARDRAMIVRFRKA